jgi:hypothetical protein
VLAVTVFYLVKILLPSPYGEVRMHMSVICLANVDVFKLIYKSLILSATAYLMYLVSTYSNVPLKIVSLALE